ncbi:MAG: hypothetical protein IKA76_00035, partial [Clostridia bacterium]|nr:hypothetical protein [Clostridia bacterium]
MLLSVYRNSPYLVGCLFSANLKDPRRSVRIGNEPLSMDQTAELVAKIRQTVADLNRVDDALKESPLVLTQSELFLCMALLAFRQSGCRFCFVEIDPQNQDPTRFLPPPFAAVICGAIPHADRQEMQAIRTSIRHGIREIVSAPQNREAHTLIANTCASVQCRLTIPARSQIALGRLTLRNTEFSYQGTPFRLGLCGKFQITNATVALESLSMLGRMGFSVSEEQKALGLANVKIPAKFEVLSSSPTIIADSTHAKVAIGTVLESLSDFRSMIGSSIRLLLPDGELVEPYIQTLSEMNYKIQRVVLLSDRNETDGMTLRFIKKKDVIRSSLDSLSADEILLISGPQDFTEEIRYDLLQSLGF